MTIKFQRNTHDADGNVREYTLRYDVDLAWQDACQLFSGHMGSSTTPMTFAELVEEHRKYDKDWPDEPFGYTVPDMLRGLALLLDADLYKVVEDVNVQQK